MAEPQHIDDEKRTLILTGASRGIGHATVKRFSSAGWRVITCSRHAFPENCPWAAGPEDHIQVDLADPRAPPGRRGNAFASHRRQAACSGQQCRHLAQGAQGERLGTLESSQELWRQVFEVNLFSTIWLAQGLKNELAKAHGAIVNVTSIAGSRVHPLRGRGLFHQQGGGGGADAGDGGGFRSLGRARQCHRAGRDRYRHPVAGTEKIVEQIRCAGWACRGSRQGDLLSVHGSIVLVTGAELMINGGQHV